MSPSHLAGYLKETRVSQGTSATSTGPTDDRGLVIEVDSSGAHVRLHGALLRKVVTAAVHDGLLRVMHDSDLSDPPHHYLDTLYADVSPLGGDPHLLYDARATERWLDLQSFVEATHGGNTEPLFPATDLDAPLAQARDNVVDLLSHLQRTVAALSGETTPSVQGVPEEPIDEERQATIDDITRGVAVSPQVVASLRADENLVTAHRADNAALRMLKDAHLNTIRTDVHTIAADLVDTLGAPNVAALAGVNRRSVYRWAAADTGTNPNHAAAAAMRTAHLVLRALSTGESPQAARAWLTTPNPQLEDTPPVDVLRAGRFDEVTAAARAYINGAWAL